MYYILNFILCKNILQWQAAAPGKPNVPPVSEVTWPGAFLPDELRETYRKWKSLGAKQRRRERSGTAKSGI
jgi:hypothetical protein